MDMRVTIPSYISVPDPTFRGSSGVSLEIPSPERIQTVEREKKQETKDDFMPK